jgi:hypothetical protein
MFIGIMRNMKELAIYSRAVLEVKVLKAKISTGSIEIYPSESSKSRNSRRSLKIPMEQLF